MSKAKIKRHPPIYRLLNGERLYYLLVTSNSTIELAKKYSEIAMEKAKLSNSYCCYVTFGVSDLLIRLWAYEDKLIKLIDSLRNNREVIKNVKVYIMNSMSTWSQRRLEKRRKWPSVIDNNSCERIMRQDVPEHMSDRFVPEDETTVKYFTFIEEPIKMEVSLYEKIKKIVQGNNTNRRQELFGEVTHISIYSYDVADRRGVLIKGQASNINKMYKSINNINSRFRVKTETYISCNRLKKGIEFNESLGLPPDNMRPHVIYNLLKSHYCYKRRFENIDKAGDINRRLEEKLSDLFELLFCYYDDEWWSMVELLRKIYRLTIFQQNSQLINLLREQYVYYEDIFKKRFEKILAMLEKVDAGRMMWTINQLKQICRKVNIDKKQEEHLINKLRENNKRKELSKDSGLSLSYQSIATYLGTLEKLAASDIKTAMHDLRCAIEDCRQDRNDIMHGTVKNLFFDRIKDRWIWEHHVVNLIKLILTFHRHQRTFEEFISNLARTSKERKKATKKKC